MEENRLLLIDNTIPEEIKKKQNNIQVLLNLFRGNIGSGILALPYAFSMGDGQGP